MNKPWSWLKGCFSHPKTTVAGLAQFAGGAALAAGMATGKVPVTSETIALAGGLVAGGVGNIAAKDAAPAAKAVTDVTTMAVGGVQIADLVQATIESEGQKAKEQKIADIAGAVASALESKSGSPVSP
jgi:hypothetical protein